MPRVRQVRPGGEASSADAPAAGLSVRIGYASRSGRHARNEDFFGMVTPEGSDLDIKGMLFAVADGVSGSGGGREAAEYGVRSILTDYYATPETWDVPHSLDKVISAVNGWLISHAGSHRELAGMASTLSALVLRGARYYLAHVGDSRIYRASGEGWSQLTQDHVWDRPDMQHVLRRALGLDAHLAVDYFDGELHAGDAFVLCSDGVWEPLGSTRMRDIVHQHRDPQAAAQELVDAALQTGEDDATVVVVRVDGVSNRSWRDSLEHELPVPPRLRTGEHIDEFEVLDLLHESRATLLYRVRAQRSGQVLALKTLQPLLRDDAPSCEGLLAEEWLSKRIVSPCFPQIVPLAPGARRALYYVMTYHHGETLQQQLERGKHFQVADVVRIGMQVGKGLAVLHRMSIVHRDIKPANLLQGEDGNLRILDLGVALAAGVPYPELQGNAGTPSFMAPELFQGEPASMQSDLYALGVTLYLLLTRRYPYGEIEPFQTPRFGDPVPPTRYRPDIPRWMEILLLRALARDRTQRFETAEEMLLALERADLQPMLPPQHTPLVHDNVTRWQAAALVLLVINLLLIYHMFIR